MKLKPEIKVHLEQLDPEKGGGLNPEAIKVNTIDSPILLIGLGGTGIDALLRTKRQIYKRFFLETTGSGRMSDKPENVEYLAIDTDDNNKRLQFEGAKFSRENNEFVLFENNKLTSIYKNRNVAIQEATKLWLSDTMRLQQIKHGAGGIRQAGRLLLFINIANIYNVINEKIQKLIQNRNTNSMIYVFIMSGMSGGTGGGTFLDIPYIVRQAAEAKGFKTENIGMLFMPDVTLSDNAIDGVAAKNVKANGFAALKELDYLMNMEKNGESLNQSYLEFEINTNEPPFDMCHLISSLDSSGKIIKNARDYCMNVASETIINFIASEEVTTGQNYTISSYLSNIENNKNAFVAGLNKKLPVNYTYNIVGVSAAELPVEKLINYLTYQVFKELDGLYDNSPTKDDLAQITQRMSVDMHSLERDLNTKMPASRDLSSYTFEVIAARPEIIEDVCRLDIERANDYLALKERELVEKFRNLIYSGESVLFEYYYDLEKGPFYTSALTSATFENSLITLFENIKKTELSRRVAPGDKLEQLKIKKDTDLQKLVKGKNSLSVMFSKKTLTEKYKKSAAEYKQTLISNQRTLCLERLYTKFAQILEEYNNEILDTYKEMLLYIKEQFDKYSNPELYKSVGTGISWELIGADELIDIVLSQSDDPSMTVNYREIIKSLLKDQMLNKDKWLDTTNVQIVYNLTKNMADQLQSIIGKSLDYFLSKNAQKNGVDIQNVSLEKISELRDRSYVMYPIGNIAKSLGIEFPPYSYLSVPTNAPRLKTTAQQFVSRTGASNIKYSNMLNKIYMMNLNIAVPLFCYREIANYEAEYEQTLTHSSGIHLYESDQKNWRNLPSPNYDKLWLNGYENVREGEKNRKIRELFDVAVEYEYIIWDEKKSKFLCSYSEDNSIDSVLDNYERNAAMIDSEDAKKIRLKLLEAINDKSRLTGKRYLYDTAFNESGFPDLEYAKGILIYMPELADKLEVEVRRHSRMLAIVEDLNIVHEREKEYGSFAQVFYMKEIYKVRRTYRYMDDEDNEQTLFTIEDLNDNYIEYGLYNAFLVIDPKHSAIMKKRAKVKESTYSNEEINKLLLSLDEEIEIFENKIAELAHSYKIVNDGEEKLKFYRSMAKIFSKEKEILK